MIDLEFEKSRMQILILLPIVSCLFLPTNVQWTVPVIQPVPISRSTTRSILLSWTPAVCTVGTVERYEIQVSCVTCSKKLWATIFRGKGRFFKWETREVSPGTAYNFQVRAVDSAGNSSPWSANRTAYTLLPAQEERFPIELIGMGKNNPGYASISLGGTTVYNCSNETGLVLAVFARSNFKLVYLSTFDTFNIAQASDALATELLKFDYKFFVLLVSSDAWELNTNSRLASVIDYCGGYYFGQWSRMPVTSWSSSADTSESSESTYLGHPYAFIGIPGSGTGMGFESLQLVTGQYLAKDKSPRAIIRAVVFFDYIEGMFKLSNVRTNTNDYFKRQQIPSHGTLHNPVPYSRLKIPASFVQKASFYVPYIGSMPYQAEQLIAANTTYSKPDYDLTNTGFQIILNRSLPQPLSFVDPRTGSFFQTELERIWGGFSPRVDMTNGSLLRLDVGPSLNLHQRVCSSFLLWRFNSTNTACSSGGCCEDFNAPGAPPFMKYGIGLWPVLCVNLTSPECATHTKIDYFEAFTQDYTPTITEKEEWLT